MKRKLFIILLTGMISSVQAQLSWEAHLQKMLHWPDILPAIQAEAHRPTSNAYYRLDSIVYMSYNAGSGSYDVLAKDIFGWYVKRNISFIPYVWDATSNSYTRSREWFYTYVNPNADDLSEVLFRYDAGSGIVDYYHLRHQYDSQGRLTDYFEENYNSTSGQLEPYDNDHFVYTGNNTKPDWDYYRLYDASQSAYANYARVNYTFNSNGILEQSTLEIWNSSSSAWVLSRKMTRTFNGNDITSELQQIWDATAGAWQNQSLMTYTYSTSGNIKTIEKVWQLWDNASSTWNNYTKEISEIDMTDNTLLSMESYDWNSGNWKGNLKMDFNYSGNTLSIEYTYWDNNTNSWMSGPTNKKIYNYDINIPGSEVIIPKKYFGLRPFYTNLSNNGQNYIHPLQNPFLYLLNSISHYTRSDPSLTWDLNGTDFYYYNNTLDVEKQNTIEHTLYPNPTTGTLHIHVQADEFDFRLYDLSGKMIFTGHFAKNEEIHLPVLEKGIYPYKVITKGGNISGKIIHH